jgi:hypothetical protein
MEERKDGYGIAKKVVELFGKRGGAGRSARAKYGRDNGEGCL